MSSRLLANGTPVQVSGLAVSVETQGAGSVRFDADPAALAPAAADVWAVQVGDDTAGWATLPTLFSPDTRRRARVGRGLATFTGMSLLESWAGHTVWYPEYDRDVIGPQSGTDRGIGWMMTAYDHTSDPREPWDRATDVSRADPPDWPAGSSAGWVTATRAQGDTSPDYAVSERKIFRGNLTIPGADPILVKIYLSSDEGATLWIGGELMLQTFYTEEGKKNTEEVAMVLWPGTYAVGVDTATHVTKGGDGVDPVIVSVWNTGPGGDPTSELWASSAATLRACRRNDSGEGSEPPGPTPGEVLTRMHAEAVARGVAGWDQVTLGFTATVDSYGQAWDQSTERIVRIGVDDYWQFFRALAETDCDIWMDGMTLHAAPQQGTASGVTLDEADIPTMADQVDLQGPGTVVLARSYAGWVQRQTAGWRREVGLEVGTALSGHTAAAVAEATLAENARWDAGPAQVWPTVGKAPLVDYSIGDTVTVDYAGLSLQARVMSIAGRQGDGGLLWEVELTDG